MISDDKTMVLWYLGYIFYWYLCTLKNATILWCILKHGNAIRLVYCFDSVGKCKNIVGNVENVVLLRAILRCSHTAHVTLDHIRCKRQDTTVSLAFTVNIPLHLRHFCNSTWIMILLSIFWGEGRRGRPQTMQFVSELNEGFRNICEPRCR